MKSRNLFAGAFGFAFFVLSGLLTFPARAITINPGDKITVSLGVLPGATTFFEISFAPFFEAPLFFPAGANMRVSLFDGGNSLLSQGAIGPLGFSLNNFTSFIDGSVDNTGHLVFDNFAVPFDFTLVVIQGALLSGFFTDSVTAQFEVTSATPLPAALPLFAGGLGVFGLLARRNRKKKSFSV